jgi:hypothetical protein
VLDVSLDPSHGVLCVRTDVGVQAIPITQAPHNFQGTRWWLRCECGARCFTLYRPLDEPRYRCRACHGLRYRSENLSRAGRLEHRAAKLAKRLGGTLLSPTKRLKGMWHSSFLQQRQRAEEANLRALSLRLSRAA